MESKYTWNYGRLTAFLVAAGNLVFLFVISLNIVVDPNFLSKQLGLQYEMNTWIKLILLLAYLTIGFIVNVGFIRRIHRSRLFLALVQTVIMAFIIRNIFVGFLFDGVHIGSYLGSIIAFIVNGVLVYNTLFSDHINKYFNEV